LGDLTGGVFTTDNLVEENNFGCFMFQSFEAVLLDQLAGLVSDIAPVSDMVKQFTGPILEGTDCPTLDKRSSTSSQDTAISLARRGHRVWSIWILTER